jgi:hypothetical protein
VPGSSYKSFKNLQETVPGTAWQVLLSEKVITIRLACGYNEHQLLASVSSFQSWPVYLPTQCIAQSCPAWSKELPPILLNLAKFVPTVHPSTSTGVIITSIKSNVIWALVVVML